MEIVQIASCDEHTLLLSMDGRVYGLGDNIYFQLGLPDMKYDTPTLIPELENIVQIATDRDYTLFLIADGRVYGIGNNVFKQMGLPRKKYDMPTLIQGIENIVGIACILPQSK
jgi:alpha-tubulin suppressor-like RCC1 family protein